MKRLILLSLLICPAAFGQSYGRQDFYLRNAQGQAVAGASVYVLTQPANISSLTPLATIYGSSTGSGTANCGSSAGQITNPVPTDRLGHACAYVAPGLYTVCYVSPTTGTSCYPDQNLYLGGVTGVAPSTQYQLPCYSGSGITIQGGCGLTTDASGNLLASGGVIGSGNAFTDLRVYGSTSTCNGTVDDTATINNAIASATNRVVFPKGGTCLVSTTLNFGTHHPILDLNGAQIAFSGTGGGTCSDASNGLMQIQSNGSPIVIENGALISNNASAGCMFNFSGPALAFAHPFNMYNMYIQGPGGTSSQIMFYTTVSGLIDMKNILASGFGQYINSTGTSNQMNNVTIENSAFQATNTGTVDIYLENPEAFISRANNYEGTAAITITGGEDCISEGDWLGDGSPATWLSFSCQGGKIDSDWISGGTTAITNTGGFNSALWISNNYITNVGTCISNRGTAFISGNYCANYTTGISDTAGNSVIAAGTFNNGSSGATAISLAGRSTTVNNPIMDISAGKGVACSGTQNVITESLTYIDSTCTSANTIINPDNGNISTFGAVTAAGNVTAGGGGNTVYRCTTAGAVLPVGALTVSSAACGASSDTGLRTK